jgi:hypothetical protein
MRTRAELQAAFSELFDEIGRAHPNEWAAILDRAKVTGSDDAVLAVSALRLTWLMRHDIPNWQATLERVAAELHEHGYDASHILTGLR